MIFLFGNKLKILLQLDEALKSENSILKNEIALLRESLEVERMERIKLSDAILKRTGFLPTTEIVNENKDMLPINSGLNGWGRIRQKLEEQSYRKSIKNNLVKPITEEELKEVDELIKNGENNDNS